MPTVNMRANMRSAVPLALGSDEDLERYVQEVEALRSRLAPGCFAIAPMCKVYTIHGWRDAGAEVSVDEIPAELDEQGHVARSGVARFHALLARGEIIEGF